MSIGKEFYKFVPTALQRVIDLTSGLKRRHWTLATATRSVPVRHAAGGRPRRRPRRHVAARLAHAPFVRYLHPYTPQMALRCGAAGGRLVTGWSHTRTHAHMHRERQARPRGSHGRSIQAHSRLGLAVQILSQRDAPLSSGCAGRRGRGLAA